MNTALDSNTAALHEEMLNEDRREAAHEAALAAWPLEDFEAQAIENLNNETGYEFMQSMLELHPDQMRRALLRTLDLTPYLPHPEQWNTILRLQDELTLMGFAIGWVEEETERLQAERIKDAR